MTATVVVRGAGSIGQRHARVFRGLDADVRLWPVRSRGPLGHDEATGVPLLDDSSGPDAVAGADLVVVATDTRRHVSDTVEALDRGAGRVLLEKPVAPTRAAAAQLAAHRRADDVWVAAPLRAHAAFRHLLAAVEHLEGRLSAHVWCQSWLPDWRPGRDYRESYSARPDEGGVLRDLVHEIDYAMVLFGEPRLLGAHLEHEGPLEMAAEQAATLLWATARATGTIRLDYVTRPASRGVVIRSAGGSLSWTVATACVRSADARGATAERHFPEDLDRDTVMATQARAALELHPTTSAAERHTAGAPATLREGLAALEVCDRARSLS